jgi:hypothetical protein
VKLQNANQLLVEELIQKLDQLRSEMLELEISGLIGAAEVHPSHAASARNLLMREVILAKMFLADRGKNEAIQIHLDGDERQAGRTKTIMLPGSRACT